jgi:hypothetical protein
MYNMQLTQINTRRQTAMTALKEQVRQLLDEVPQQARELVSAGCQRHVPAKTVFVSLAILGLFKIATGIYCTLVAIAAMQNVSLIRVP